MGGSRGRSVAGGGGRASMSGVFTRSVSRDLASYRFRWRYRGWQQFSMFSWMITRLIGVYKPDDIGFIVGRVKNTPFRARIDDLVGCFSVFPPKLCFMVPPAPFPCHSPLLCLVGGQSRGYWVRVEVHIEPTPRHKGLIKL